MQLFLPQNGVPPPSPEVTGGGDSLLSPPSVASLLDISLPGPPEEALTPGEPQTQISDSIIELAINSTHYGACTCRDLTTVRLPYSLKSTLKNKSLFK